MNQVNPTDRRLPQSHAQRMRSASSVSAGALRMKSRRSLRVSSRNHWHVRAKWLRMTALVPLWVPYVSRPLVLHRARVDNQHLVGPCGEIQPDRLDVSKPLPRIIQCPRIILARGPVDVPQTDAGEMELPLRGDPPFHVPTRQRVNNLARSSLTTHRPSPRQRHQLV